MTRKSDEIKIESKIVVTFDICSSSDILEDLHLTENVKAWRNFLIDIKKFLVKESKKLHFIVYKFTGDGWILLFNDDTNGKKLIDFLNRLSRFFKIRYHKRIDPLLETKPEISGLTFGMDRGKLVRIVMLGQREYIGRAVNIACRLQGAIKDRGGNPQYKVLLSKHLFKKLSKSLGKLKTQKVTRTLKNIAGGRKYRCIKLYLPVD